TETDNSGTSEHSTEATENLGSQDTNAEADQTATEATAAELAETEKSAAQEPAKAPTRPARRIGRGGPAQPVRPGDRRPNSRKAKKERLERNRAKRRKPITAAKAGRMATSTIVMFVVVGIAALAIIGYAVYRTYDASRPFGQQRAQKIDGVVNYREKDPKMLSRNHVAGPVKYKGSPPVGGNHNQAWETCMGEVFAQQIPKEHAVHSLEHGAVWITYNPNLPRAEVDKLAKKVRGEDFMLMSPYPGLKSPISLQAWGFQLKLKSANDSRIQKFIVAFRKEASVEPGSGCSDGVLVTGDQPTNDPQAGMGGAPVGGLPPELGQ
ncbi:MAG: DUF3105 domain-containing protein, partial [Pseudonocardiaceae bacterium]